MAVTVIVAGSTSIKYGIAQTQATRPSQ